MAAGVAQLAALSALLQFLQCHLWIVGRADNFDALVLYDRGRDPLRWRNQLRIGEQRPILRLVPSDTGLQIFAFQILRLRSSSIHSLVLFSFKKKWWFHV